MTEWTLAAWIEHSERLREMETRLRNADRDLFLTELQHVRDIAATRKESDDIHFAQLNENMERTIEERGHFVSVEAFGPFKEHVLERLQTHVGEQTGGSNMLHWIVSIASVLFGLVGILFAIFTRLAAG